MPMNAHDFFFSIPPVTRTVVGACIATTFLTSINAVSPLRLYLYFSSVFAGEYWRLVTNFFFIESSFSLNFLFHIIFMYRHSKSLEEQYAGRTADFLLLWLFGAFGLLAVDFGLFQFAYTKQYFVPILGPSLCFMVVYVWSRRNPRVHMNFLGLFTFTAPYLPWVFLAFGLLLGNNPIFDLLGIVVGHVYFYLADVLPHSTGIHIIRAPGFLKALLDRPEQPMAPPPAAPADMHS